MVCVPCFIIPILLYIWHKFIQPILLRYWNPWEKKDAEGNVIKAGPDFPFQCKGGVCPFPAKDNNKYEKVLHVDENYEQKIATGNDNETAAIERKDIRSTIPAGDDDKKTN